MFIYRAPWIPCFSLGDIIIDVNQEELFNITLPVKIVPTSMKFMPFMQHELKKTVSFTNFLFINTSDYYFCAYTEKWI